MNQRHPPSLPMTLTNTRASLFALLLVANPALAAPIAPDDIRVIDGDTIRVYHTQPNVRLAGFNAPETWRPACDAEAELGAKATRRVRDLMRAGDLEFEFVACSWPHGTEGTQACNYGRKCGTLKANGRDVGAILIAEGLAAPFQCGTTSCPRTPRPSDGSAQRIRTADDARQHAIQKEDTVVSHPNRDLILRAYSAFGRGDIPSVLGILDKEIRWHVPGQSALSGDYFGHEQVLGFFQKCMDLSEGTLNIKLDDIVASDTTVFVLCTVSATRSGQHAEFLEVHVWRIADDRAIEFREFQGDENTENKFFA
jgi:endonuclease YncB( thermonuclease family)/ketosteroid isomerase-like protein